MSPCYRELLRVSILTPEVGSPCQTSSPFCRRAMRRARRPRCFPSLEVHQCRSDAMAGHLDRHGLQQAALHDFNFERERLPGRCGLQGLAGIPTCARLHLQSEHVSTGRFEVCPDLPGEGDIGERGHQPVRRFPNHPAVGRYTAKLIDITHSIRPRLLSKDCRIGDANVLSSLAR